MFGTKLIALLPVLAIAPVSADTLPLIDTHIHYSRDTWEQLSPAEAVAVLRNAGLRKAFVSSSSDDGTQKLHSEAPDLIVPVLRPYRRRGETGTWFQDDSVIELIESRVERYHYAGIGEFHVSGEDADSPVMRRIIDIARDRRLFLHAHSDADAVERIFARDPHARVLWAHAGFASPEVIGNMLARYRNLWCDLAFRSDQARDGKVSQPWRALFETFPDRFTVGTDTYTPARWDHVVEHATWSRRWLADLPADVARRIAYENAEALLAWTRGK